MATGYVKMMGGDDLPDTHPSKGFSLLTLREGEKVTFRKANKDDGSPNGASVENGHVMVHDLANGDRETYDLAGNVYVMNDAGKTIASYGICS